MSNMFNVPPTVPAVFSLLLTFPSVSNRLVRLLYPALESSAPLLFTTMLLCMGIASSRIDLGLIVSFLALRAVGPTLFGGGISPDEFRVALGLLFALLLLLLWAMRKSYWTRTAVEPAWILIPPSVWEWLCGWLRGGERAAAPPTPVRPPVRPPVSPPERNDVPVRRDVPDDPNETPLAKARREARERQQQRILDRERQLLGGGGR